MKYFAKTVASLFAVSLLFSTAAVGQAFLPQQPEPPFKQPDAPQLPYHFDTQITGANGEQFGNVAAVAIRPNGNLLVAGERNVGLNKGVNALRFSGIVNPRDIRPGNVVASRDVVNASLESVAQGDVSEASSRSWLQRVLARSLSIW